MAKNLEAVVGDYNVICDRTGAKIKASDAVLQWDGLLVHKDWAEDRHPLDFVPSIEREEAVPVSRPQVTATFLNPGDVTKDNL